MTEDEEKRAREEAQARRQKILQSSSDRLGVVTGAVLGGGDAGDDGDDNGGGEEAKKAKTMSKMAQARRRRFKKKDDGGATQMDAVAAATAATPEATAAAEEPVAPPAEESKAEAEAPERAPPVPVPVAALEPTRSEENASGAVKETEDVAPPVDAATATDEHEPETSTSKKKYQGVARVRRQMLKEKQQQKKSDTGGEINKKDGAGSGTEAAASPSGAAHPPPPRARATWYSTLPILMHLVTTLLLFGAGLDVGMQQRPSPLAVVETEWAPQQEVFALRMVPRLLWWKNRTAGAGASDMFLPSADELLRQAEARELVVEDEFAGDDKLADGAGKEEPTIDPVFGVDLDALTQGDDLYMVLGRFAVRVHRALLGVVYYLPIRMYSYLMGTLQQLAKSPPLLCLLAITIRQVVGKAILGAKLPKPKSLDDESSKEVTNIIVQAVKGFFLRAFPNVFTLYDIFSHLKNDMYVVLCGLLVGLALRHSVLMPTESPVPDAGAVIDAIKEEEVVSAGTDEL